MRNTHGTSQQTRYALKEWPTAIQALEQGYTSLLFRKGGIHEKGARFELPCQSAVLFPTFEHEKAHFLKSSTHSPTEQKAYQIGELIRITSWVRFVASIEIYSVQDIQKLEPFHIWTKEFLLKRFNWKPERPLFMIFCETFRFNVPLEIPYLNEFKGCKSWLEFSQEIELSQSQSVLSKNQLTDRFSKIESLTLQT